MLVSLFVLLVVSMPTQIFADSLDDILCNDMPGGSKTPHPEYCNVYLVCNNDQAEQRYCPKGVLFNPEVEECDPDYDFCPSESFWTDYEDVETTAPSTTVEIQSTTTTTTTTVKPETTSVVVVTTKPTQSTVIAEVVTAPSIAIENISTVLTTPFPDVATGTTAIHDLTIIECPGSDSDKIMFIRHPLICSAYYLCYHGKPVPIQCSMGLFWSQKHVKCVPQEFSECEIDISYSYPACPRTGLHFLPHPDRCDYFLFCRNGTKTIQQCEAFFSWDINERKCKLKSLATCYVDYIHQ